MLEGLSEPLKRFLGFIGGISATLTTLFTAAGFLAVRAHLVMLGLPSTSFDFQQYVEVGARFMAYLPVFLGIALLSLMLEALAWLFGLLARHGGIALVAVLLLSGLLFFRGRLRARWHGWQERRRLAGLLNAVGKLRSSGRALFKSMITRPGWLILFLLIQFIGAYQLTQALEVHNLLFAATLSTAQGPHIALSMIDTSTLVAWIREGDTVRASQYLGWLFLITLLTAWALYRVMKSYRSRDGKAPRLWQLAWVAASLMLFITQVTLLPVNYGVLLSSNQFAEVSLQYQEPEPAVRPPDARLVLLHETGDGYYLYARSEGKMWYILRADVRSLRYHGMVRVLEPAISFP